MASDGYNAGRTVDGEWQPYGGACQCRKCREKIRRSGFWRAPPDYEAEVAYQAEVDEDWWRRRAAQIPPIRRGEAFEDYKKRVRPDLPWQVGGAK